MNTYFFQSKNPSRFSDFQIRENDIVCTTIESNRDYEGISKAPSVKARMEDLRKIALPRKHVTIEPIMDFDIDILAEMIRYIEPEDVKEQINKELIDRNINLRC